MRAMVLRHPSEPLHEEQRSDPRPGARQLLLRVRACGVCRTDLHIVDGELRDAGLPLIPGHQIVGIVEANGPEASRFPLGTRVGVSWLGWTDESCDFCVRGLENLCRHARFTGYNLDGGYADLVVADERFCFPLPEGWDDSHVAPLLCAGMIGFRALRMTDGATTLGFYGFGSSAHILAQLAIQRGSTVHAFTRPGDTAAQEFARRLGAAWAGGSDELPSVELDAAIIFAPAGLLVPTALRAVRPGGTVVCAGIHMTDIPRFPYELLWGERVIRSVANVTRRDGEELFRAISGLSLHLRTNDYPLTSANQALSDLRAGAFEGSAVLIP